MKDCWNIELDDVENRHENSVQQFKDFDEVSKQGMFSPFLESSFIEQYQDDIKGQKLNLSQHWTDKAGDSIDEIKKCSFAQQDIDKNTTALKESELSNEAYEKEFYMSFVQQAKIWQTSESSLLDSIANEYRQFGLESVVFRKEKEKFNNSLLDGFIDAKTLHSSGKGQE